MSEKLKSFFTNPAKIKAIIMLLIYYGFFITFAGQIAFYFLNKLCISINGIPIKECSNNTIFTYESLINLVCYIVMIIPVFLLYSYELIYDFYHTITIKNYKKFFLKMLGLFYITIFIAGIISNLLVSRTSENEQSIDAVLTSNPSSFILMAIAACLIGPIVEEIVFRQAIFDLFNDKRVSIFISCIAFASVHILTSSGTPLEMIGLIIPYIASGFIFSLTYEKSNRNIWLPILLHSLTNLISVLLTVVLA